MNFTAYKYLHFSVGNLRNLTTIFQLRSLNVKWKSTSFSENVWTRIWNKKTPQQSINSLEKLPSFDDSCDRKVTTSRLMSFNDSNIRGFVHGGTVLQLLEEAACLAANKYCNTSPEGRKISSQSLSTVVCVQEARFYSPVNLFVLCRVNAEVIFTSQRSLLVCAKLYSIDVTTGEWHFANEALLWYTAVCANDIHKVVNVPKYQIADDKQRHTLKHLYERQKLERQQQRLEFSAFNINSSIESAPKHSVAASYYKIIHVVEPTDCLFYGYCQGGVILRYMDSCGGMVAMQHCGGEVVTVGLEWANFRQRLELGSIIEVKGRIVFASKRSVEVQVQVSSFSPFDDRRNLNTYKQCAEAYFTYVGIDSNGKPTDVPELKVLTPEEKLINEKRRKNYERRKMQSKASV